MELLYTYLSTILRSHTTLQMLLGSNERKSCSQTSLSAMNLELIHDMLQKKTARMLYKTLSVLWKRQALFRLWYSNVTKNHIHTHKKSEVNQRDRSMRLLKVCRYTVIQLSRKDKFPRCYQELNQTTVLSKRKSENLRKRMIDRDTLLRYKWLIQDQKSNLREW